MAYRGILTEQGKIKLKTQLTQQGWEPDLEDWEDEISTLCWSEDLEYRRGGFFLKLEEEDFVMPLHQEPKHHETGEEDRPSLFELFGRSHPKCTAGCHDWACCTPCGDPDCNWCKGFDRS